MAEALLTAFCLLTALVVCFYWLPAMTQLFALTRLHELRDRLYAAAARYPAFRSTELYRDLEFVYVTSIHVTRDRSWFDTLMYMSNEKRTRASSRCPHMGRAPSPAALWRRARRGAPGK